MHSKLYWFKHFEYVGGKGPKQEDDVSNAKWTKLYMDNLLRGRADKLFGAEGYRGFRAMEMYTELYYGARTLAVVRATMRYYLENYTEKPARKLRKYLS